MDEKRERLGLMENAWSQCQGCMLHHERNNVVFGYGAPDADLMVIGESPGIVEDQQNVPFIGASGSLLEYFLAWTSADEEQVKLLSDWQNNFEISRLEWTVKNTYLTNIVSCRPPENRNPTPKEIKTCRPRLLETIYTVDPVLIITMGGLAAEALTRKKISITALRGQIIDCTLPGRYGDVTYPVLMVLHPSYLLRQNDFRQDGGMADKTYNDFVTAGHILDDFNFHHRGIPRPITRPPIKEGLDD